ncbi:MAG: oligopeptide/dipeptide ABC transporter ATP-binding protein [Chlamydiales bacterium]|jgi:oligopeptide/dipeptide ABC transporter ATP-binding protein
MNPTPLLEIRKIQKHFPLGDRIVKAVENFSLDIYPGETIGLVGESGCGKSTLGRTILRLYEATNGEVIFGGRNLFELSKKEMLAVRRDLQMIFQDPYASLNPRMTVQDIVGEALDIHKLAYGSARNDRVAHLLETVGLKSDHMSRYPHEFSGGQRQRIGIARALAVSPKFIVCDEPISALDVSIQAQVVNLLKDLQVKMGLTYLFIAHDLSMVEYISDRVAVMYKGSLVELATSSDLYREPLHPYTQSLLSAIPIPDPKIEKARSRIDLKEASPSLIPSDSGNEFQSHCPIENESCYSCENIWHEVKEGHFVMCHRH